MNPALTAQVRAEGFVGTLDVLTSSASPTGFPFKLVQGIPGTLAEQSVYEKRHRVCNKGYLVSLHRNSAGEVVLRCAAEPIDAFVRKGGSEQEAIGKVCLCNGLLSAASVGDAHEPPVITLGDYVGFLKQMMVNSESTYTAHDALRYLLS